LNFGFEQKKWLQILKALKKKDKFSTNKHENENGIEQTQLFFVCF